jgi:hypothetical protein
LVNNGDPEEQNNSAELIVGGTGPNQGSPTPAMAFFCFTDEGGKEEKYE